MTNGLTDDAVLAYAAQISDLEDDREAVQTDLKTAWGHIREAHGKRFADSLKLAVKRARMKSEQRQQASEIDAEADRIVALIHAGPRVRVARGAHEADYYSDVTPEAVAKMRAKAAPQLEAMGFDPETGEIIETGNTVSDSSGPVAPQVRDMLVSATRLPGAGPDTIPGNGAGGAEGEAVANDAKPSAQHSEPVRGAGTVADGAGKPETSDASSAEIPGVVSPAQPNGADPRTPVDAATVGETADHSEPAEVPPPPSSAAPGDGSAAHPSAARVVANVVQLRSYNPETHFLNSTGLSRLHGCLKPDMCGSSQPRAKLCFSCSVKHDGPTFQAVAE